MNVAGIWGFMYFSFCHRKEVSLLKGIEINISLELFFPSFESISWFQDFTVFDKHAKYTFYLFGREGDETLQISTGIAVCW